MIWLYVTPPSKPGPPTTKEQERRLLWIAVATALFGLGVLFFGPR